VLAAEYRTVLPDVKRLAEELEKTQRDLEGRRKDAPPLRSRHKPSSASNIEQPD